MIRKIHFKESKKIIRTHLVVLVVLPMIPFLGWICLIPWWIIGTDILGRIYEK